MQAGQPSRTAWAAAAHRAAHQILEQGRIFCDPLAVRILGQDGETVAREAAEHPSRRRMRLFIAVRTRFAEDALAAAVERGVRQLVVLGAGLDTYAYRSPFGERLRMFEVDHPSTQAWKRGRLAEAGIALPGWLTFAPVDFERESLAEGLEGAGFDREAPSFFTWLGVVPYLTEEAIDRTLDYVSSIQGSAVVFDYMEPPEGFSEELRQIEKERTEQLKKIGERSVSRFEPAGMGAILRSHGFCAIEDIDYDEIASRFGGGVQGLAPGHAGLHVVHAKH